MAPPLIQLTDIHLTFGGDPLLEGVNLSVSAGERVCLVGRNGSGKSTLLKIAAGQIEPDAGTRFVQPGALVKYLAQEPDLTAYENTLAYVTAGLGPTDDAYQARYMLERVGLTGQEDTHNLSGGEARRAALAHALAPNPDILLLDEPTNHLDLPAIEWLETELKQLTCALVLISHDRLFLETLSRTTVWLDRGVAQRVDIGFGQFEAWRDQKLAEEETAQHKLDRKIVAEEHWVRYGVTARRKRNVKRMANLAALRTQRREWRRAAGKAVLETAAAEPSGALVIEAKGIGKAYAGRDIVKDLSTRVMRGDRLGIVGPNGAGKTTLVNLLTGRLAPDEGAIKLGANIEMVSLEQNRDSLDPNWTLKEALTGGRGDTVKVGGETRHVMSYLKDFLFTPQQARTPLRVLSGGERGRLMLARALAKPSNLLVLDEPTNDLDLEMLDVLEEMLGDYTGTVILISHDRDFLDRVVNAVIVPEGNGHWQEYAGGYADMLAQRGGELAAPARNAPATAPREKTDRTDTAPDTATGPAQGKRKLSFKEKHALETLPATMAALEKKIAMLQQKLAAPDLYQRDRKAFETATADLGKAQGELTEAEERWLELELLRESLG